VPTQSPGGSTGQKTVLFVRLYIQTIILPRQARDKHRKKSKKRTVFLAGMTLVGLKSYNQTVTDNIIADSSHDAGVWLGESGGLGGVYTVERNIFSNFTEKGQCGGGEYSQAGAALCYRDMEMIATNTIGGLLNETYLKGVCGNASAPPSAKTACTDPAWFGFSPAELQQPLLTSVNSNLYTAPLDPKTAALPKLRPDIDTKSIGGVGDPGFVRTPFSQWWNRTHLDYALAPSSPAFHSSVGFQPADLNEIGLRASWHARFDSTLKGLRAVGVAIQSESADRAFGLYLEPSFGEKNVLFAPFIYKMHHFYQDRLGTNIGKTPKKSFFLRDIVPDESRTSRADRAIGLCRLPQR
jgi:hypothetical protein